MAEKFLQEQKEIWIESLVGLQTLQDRKAHLLDRVFGLAKPTKEALARLVEDALAHFDVRTSRLIHPGAVGDGVTGAQIANATRCGEPKYGLPEGWEVCKAAFESFAEEFFDKPTDLSEFRMACHSVLAEGRYCNALCFEFEMLAREASRFAKEAVERFPFTANPSRRLREESRRSDLDEAKVLAGGMPARMAWEERLATGASRRDEVEQQQDPEIRKYELGMGAAASEIGVCEAAMRDLD